MLGLALLSGLGAVPAAQADIFLCVDANGRRELTDTNRAGCKPLDVPGGIAAPPARKASGSTAPRAPVTTPSGFPRVDGAQQRARDNDRREILNDELRNEMRKLTELKAEFKNGEPDRLGNERNYAKYQERVEVMRASIARVEKNIEALNREIANIK